MAEELKIYLDHLIERQSLRYKRSTERMERDRRKQYDILRCSDLFSGHMSSRVDFLRKPDFQRATYSWTAQDCVELLESVVNEQVIPSIIMWQNQDSQYDYVLDGGHRVSVIIAWMQDDWGESAASDKDEEEADIIKKAAAEVRDLVRVKVGMFSEYEAAEKVLDDALENLELERTANKGETQDVSLSSISSKMLKQGRFYRKLRKGDIGLHILWVEGNYEKAEQSFLKINKTGKKLSPWEITLVENRNSSFARTVMSVANIGSASHYWPTKGFDSHIEVQAQQTVVDILNGVEKLHEAILRPPLRTPIHTLDVPLLAADIKDRPPYLAELFTVVKGFKGQEAETERIIAKDRDATPEVIINNGKNLIIDALDVIGHLTGDSNNSKSLAVVPAMYFYSESGRHVRSLLYGFIYWLFSGGDNDEILTRKRIFSAHRQAFESKIMEKDIVPGLGRKSGSGPEVTIQTAHFYEELLQLLIKHNDAIQEESFTKDYKSLIKEFTTRRTREDNEGVGSSRRFTPRQRSAAILDVLIKGLGRCGICGGLMDATKAVQHDHITEVHKGGKTTMGNQRLTHPFCNNQPNREAIEQLKSGHLSLNLPKLIDPETDPGFQQLRFIFDSDFS